MCVASFLVPINMIKDVVLSPLLAREVTCYERHVVFAKITGYDP